VYVSIAGLVMAMIVWRAFEQLHGADLASAAISCGLTFVLITTLGMRLPRIGHRRELRHWLGMAAIPAALAVLSWSLDDPTMAALSPVAVAICWVMVERTFDRLPRPRHLAVFKAAWLLWGVELVLVLCIAPALLLSRFSNEYETNLRLRDSEWRLWNAEAESRKAIERTIEQIPGVSKHPETRDKLRAAVRLSGPTPPLYYYGADTSRIALVSATAHNADCAAAPAGTGSRFELASGLAGWVLARIEVPSEERLMGVDARESALKPAGNLWTWQERGRSLWLCQGDTVLARAGLPVFDPFRTRPDVVHASTKVGDGLPGPGEFDAAVPVWMVLMAMLAGVAMWMNALRRRLLLIGAPGMECSPYPQYDEKGAAPPRLFLLTYPEHRVAELPENLRSYDRIDLSREEFRLDANALPDTTAKGLLLDHFEHRFQDPQVRAARLESLKAALLAQNRPIAIRSAIDCARYLAGGSSDEIADELELKQWCMAMNYFERRRPASAPAVSTDHAAIWDTCSEHDKEVLMQICRHGLVNPRAFHVVCGLLQRGLIRRTRDYVLRFSSAEFRQFVAGATVMVSEKRSPKTSVRRLPAYAIGLLLLGLLLLFSQEELTTRLIGFLTTVTGGFETVRKQLAGIQDAGAAKKS
jgi:hypothetical protein